jgi:hypothetical protein
MEGRLFQAAFSAILCGITASYVYAADSPRTVSTNAMEVPRDGGNTRAMIEVTGIPGFKGDPPHWTTYVHKAYFPSTGNAWTGVSWAWDRSAEQDSLALVDGCVLGIYYNPQQNAEKLCVVVSTNKYAPGMNNLALVMQAELTAYTNSPRRFLPGLQYGIYLEKLLGSAVLRDHADTNMWAGQVVLDIYTRPSKFKGVTVEGTNAVVALEFGTNMLARIAFDKDVKPVWATTNGVSIGPIPRNCVFGCDVISNRIVTKVVY